MVQSTPETNMAILANGAELTRLTVSSMMSDPKVRDFFDRPAVRENVYQTFAAAVMKRLEPTLRNRPTGQFKKSVQEGGQTGRQTNPNITA